MNTNTQILQEAAGLAGRGTPFVMITVMSTQGSSPREPGAKMIYIGKERLIGSIGGGELEHLALDTAGAVIVTKQGKTER